MDRHLQRILFVEDDHDVRSVAGMALEAVGGFSVLACASGSEALARAEDFAPDLVLLDVLMPEMDGPATLGALRQKASLREVPVIFLTAAAEALEISAYLALGAAAVLAKPFDPMTLPEQVRSIWSRLRLERSDAGSVPYREHFAGRLPERLREIEQAWHEVRDSGWAAEKVRTFHRLAHSLAGAGATFGFPAVTAAARRLENALKSSLDGAHPKAAVTRTEELLLGLRRAAEPTEGQDQ